MAWNCHIPGAFPGHGEPSYTFSPPPPFADFFGFGHAGSGVDHQGPFHPAFVFGTPGSFGGRGRCARRGGCGRPGQTRHSGPAQAQAEAQAPEQTQDREKADSAENIQDPPEVAPEENTEQPPPYGTRHGHEHRGRGRGRGRHHGAARGQFPFDPSFFIRAFSNHPLAQNLRDWAEQAARAAGDNTASGSGSDAFSPPMDLFSNEREFVLHLALPGAKKEDIGVNWDADKGELRVAGVVHRPGDEEFLQGLVEGERKVGMFERTVTLPPEGSSDAKDEVDGLGITAKMEDGVLVVVVPKVEKEWTEVRKVDIE